MTTPPCFRRIAVAGSLAAPIRAVLFACAAALSLAACQTVEQPRTTALGDKDGEIFRERRGWFVGFVPASNGAPAHCRGRRTGSEGGLPIVFIGGEKESGFLLPGAAGSAGERDAVVAAFDNGDQTAFEVRRDGDALLYLGSTAQYEDLMHPFARARSASLRLKSGAPLGETSLNGSSWAVNATDECRRMKVQPAR